MVSAVDFVRMLDEDREISVVPLGPRLALENGLKFCREFLIKGDFKVVAKKKALEVGCRHVWVLLGRERVDGQWLVGRSDRRCPRLGIQEVQREIVKFVQIRGALRRKGGCGSSVEIRNG